MKSSSLSFHHRALFKLAVLTPALCFALPALVQAALNVNTPANVSINDEQATNLFAGASVTQGGTNVVKVFVDFSPANLGALSLPPNGALVNGTNVLTVTNAADAQASLRAVLFTPVANFIPVPNSSNLTFHVRALDADDNSTSDNTTLHITALPNAPTLTTLAPFTDSITDKTNTLVFTGVSIADVDDGGTQPVTVTVTLDATNKGTFTSLSGFTNNGLTYTFTAPSASATAAVRALVFVPATNRVPVGLSETTTFTISVDDGLAATNSSAYSVTALSVNDAPQLTGVSLNHLPVQTGNSLSPFSQVTLVDFDQNVILSNFNGEDLSYQVTLSGPTNIPTGSLVLNGNDIGATFSGSGDPLADSAQIRTLTYQAPTAALAGTNVLTLAITASDGHSGGTVSNNVYLDLYSLITAPILSGTQSGQAVYDNSTIAPFSKVSIQGFNGNNITVRIALANQTNDIQGQLVSLGSFTKIINANAPSDYQFTGTSEAATTALRALAFQPTPNRINGSSNELCTLRITLIDSLFTNYDSSTTVRVFPVNDTPGIAGISSFRQINDSQTLTVFPLVSITDPDENGQQPVTATITLDNSAKGYFNAASLQVSGFSSNSSGYTYSGPATAITAALRQLVFVPTPAFLPVGLFDDVTFAINLNDGFNGIVNDSGSIVRVQSVGGFGPAVNLPSQPASIPIATNLFPFANVTVSGSTLLNLGLRINDLSKGAFTTNSVIASGFTNRGGGVYFISGQASALNTSLAQLAFTPATNLLVGSIITFTITVTNTQSVSATASHAIVLRAVQNSIIVTKLTDYDPNVSVPASQKYGTLRLAVANAKNNDHITFDIRSTTEGQPDYPAVIRLVAPLGLNHNLTFDGPGAERLAISGDSDGNGTADVQLFTINAAVTMNRLTFTKGNTSSAGGAFEVLGDLKLNYCAVTDSKADFWGGGIDVDGGSLALNHCLIAGNSTSSSFGQGGGGVSLYTYWACSIANTTFSTNRQNAAAGLGGGGLYVETQDPGIELDVQVVNCTFRDNRDAAGHGTSIRPNVFNTVVRLQNTMVADGQGKNIEMDQSGDVLSLGGNISDDSTASTFSAGGVPLNTFIFHAPADQTNVNIASLMAALSNNGGPTLTYPLTTNSPAIGMAVSNVPGSTVYSNTLGTDQRGYFRDHSPDIGAFERGAGQRIIIEELRFNAAPPNTNDQFVEFYVPRDAINLDVGGFKVLVDGVPRHTFTSQPMQPGQALVLFSAGTVSNGVPPGVLSQTATNKLMMDTAGGTITLLNASNQVVFEADYVGAFAPTDPNDAGDYGFLSANYQSLVLSPQFQGVFLPYQRVVAKAGGSNTNGLANPGYDANGNPLAIGNAPPLAYADSVGTDAHTLIPALNVLGNDVDPDIADVIRVVAVGTNGAVAGFTNYSVLGARIIINVSPTTGATVSYDPTASSILTALPQGSNVVDSFQYTILDSLNGVDHLRSATTNAAEIALNLAKATATVTVSVVGVNAAPTPKQDDVTTRTNLTTPEDAVLDFTTATNLLWNDTDPNSDDNNGTLSIISISPTNGQVPNLLSLTSVLGATVTLDIRFDRNQTHITYDPRGSAILNALNRGQTTNDTFYYSVKDRYDAVGTAAVSIQVTGVNDAPTANPNSLATDEDTAITNSAASLLGNDTDPDNGHVLTILAVTPVSALGASVSLNGTNLIYNPTVSTNLNALANKEFATDTFTCTVTDEYGLTSDAVITVIVAGVNDHPIPQADFYSTDEDTALTATTPGVLANDRDPDVNGILPDDSIRVIPATNTTPGGVSVVMNADGSFGYDPRGKFDWLKFGSNTTETISYVVMDHSLSIANDDSFTVIATTSNNLLPVLANDVVLSQAGGAFTLTGVTTPNQGGTAVLNASNNAIIYTPPAGFAGAETFRYAVADGLGGSDQAIVTVTVTASTLYANADAFAVARGTTNALDVLANDNILPATGAAISVSGLGATDQGGMLSLNGAGPNNLINYTPNPAHTGDYVETFTYTVTSGSLVSTGAVSVAVFDRNNALTLAANNDFFTVLLNGGTTSLDVLANDLTLPGPNTNLVITSFINTNLLGTVSLNTAHTRLVYKPSATVTSTNGYSDLIPYYFSDNAGGTGTATLTVNVIASGFIANDDYFVVEKNSGSNTLPVMINDTILPNLGQTLFISDLGTGTNSPTQGGAVAINGAGTGLIYTPGANFSGNEDFTYEISDGSPSRALGHVHVHVADHSAVVSNPDVYRVQRDSVANSLPVLQNDYTLPRTPGALTLTGLQTNGVQATVAINGASANNSLLYSPATGFIGTDRFSYEFTDTLGNKGTNRVTVTVGNLAPQADRFSVLSGTATNRLDVLANDLAYPDTNSVRPIYLVGTPDHGGAASADAGGTTIIYTPPPGFTGTERFTYTLEDDSSNLFTATAAVQVYARGSDRATNTATLTVVGVNDLPVWAGNANRAITDKQTVQPFSTLALTDLDEHGLQLQTVRIFMDHPDNGTLQNLGAFTQAAPGAFLMSGTPAAITATLHSIVFAPVPNHIPCPTTVTTHFSLSADDGYVLAPVTNLTTVDVTAVNDAPVISGTVAGQTVYSHSSIKPFAGALITEVDNDRTQVIRVTVTLDNAIKGGLSSLGGFTDLGAGVYSIGASNGNVTAASATVALRGLLFTPTVGSRVSPGTTETTRFTIRVDDFFAPTVLDANTTVVAIHPFTAKVTASDKTSGAQFGWSVAATRDLAVVGAPHDSTGTGSGSAYLYARSLDGLNTWTQIKKLLPPSGHGSDEFGTAVAISGDTIVVGARLRDDSGTDSGAAYVFTRNQGGSDQWGFVKQLLPADGAAGDQFGTAVSISGDNALIGSPLANASGLGDSGAAYVFARNQGGTNQWGQMKKLVASVPAASDHFGSAVSISVDTLAVGSPLVGGSGAAAGAAYVYSRNQGGADQWGFVTKLLAGDGSSNGLFGTAISISGDILAVSAPLVNASGLGNSGAAYVFTRNAGGANQWGQVKRLLASDPATGDRFGSALAINADSLVVSSQLADGNGTDSGAAYLFSQNQGGSNLWGQVDKFLPSAVGASDNFGSAVAISSGTIVIGAYNGLDSGVRYGTAFMFRIKYNNGPQLLIPLADQTVILNSPLAFTVPAGTFADPDFNETLQLSLAASPVAPAWLIFDPVTAAFSGTPTAVNSYALAVSATDSDGASATTQFVITVLAVANTHATLSMGFQTVGASQVAVVSLNGVSGAGYRLQRTPSLSGTVIWTDVATNTADGSGTINFYDANSTGSMFYRAVAQ